MIAAPSSTKNKDSKRDSEMHQTQNGKQWHFGMKAHITVDAASGIVHSVVGTAVNAHDVTQANALVREADKEVFADAGYQGALQRPVQEHATTHHVVCVGEPKDGAQANCVCVQSIATSKNTKRR